MKNILLSAALILGAASAAHAGQNPVITGVPVVASTTITVTTATPEFNRSRPSLRSFFNRRPPAKFGGGFTFRLIGNE